MEENNISRSKIQKEAWEIYPYSNVETKRQGTVSCEGRVGHPSQDYLTAQCCCRHATTDVDNSDKLLKDIRIE